MGYELIGRLREGSNGCLIKFFSFFLFHPHFCASNISFNSSFFLFFSFFPSLPKSLHYRKHTKNINRQLLSNVLYLQINRKNKTLSTCLILFLFFLTSVYHVYFSTEHSSSSSFFSFFPFFPFFNFFITYSLCPFFIFYCIRVCPINVTTPA